jgi:pimeloyl-ACP methyl ester carboxylesterase
VPDAYNGDVRIHFEISGTGDALLVLPGLGVDSRELRGLVEPLAKDRTVVVVDNRGVGRSDKPDEPYTIELMAADAIAVLDAAGIERASVLGYSMGGRIALHLAITHPQRVDRLVLLATGARTIATWNRNLLFAVSPYLPVGPTPRQPVFAFKRQRAASQGYDGRRRLPDVQAPTLILHGRRDRVAPPELAEELREGIPDSRLEWYDGGHVRPVFKPGPIVDALRGFLV